MPATYINNGGTWQRAKRIFINDNGVWRAVRGIFVNNGGTWQRVYSGVEDIAMVAGIDSYAGTPPFYTDAYTTYGFVSLEFGAGIGSVSPTTQGGYVIGQIARFLFSVPGSYDVFSLGGLTSDPGQSFFDSITISGIAHTSASASYNYDAVYGQASWYWPATWAFGAGATTAVFT